MAEQYSKKDYKRLYEQAKRVIVQLGLQHNIVHAGGRPFILACRECGLPFREDVEVGLATEHMKLEHGKQDDELQLDLIYIGKGDPPRARS